VRRALTATDGPCSPWKGPAAKCHLNSHACLAVAVATRMQPAHPWLAAYRRAAAPCAQIVEEAGFSPAQLQLLRYGRPLLVDDGKKHFLVHPFLYKPLDPEAQVRVWWASYACCCGRTKTPPGGHC